MIMESFNRAELGREVRIDEVSRHYGSVRAVSEVSLTVAAGEFVSLLGPSGSGKTTLLMMLAGFEHPENGTIRVGGRDVTRVAPNKRDIAMVFQRYALFPHMTVAQNIAFPLEMRGVSKAERDARVARSLEMVKLSGYEKRRPSELSGGQQQRVALARAIVFEPPVILMDEPLGALDKKLRQHMQIELKQLQRRLGATVIYVTHDQEEALVMSDRVAVMSQGRLMQLGSPRELYNAPAHPFVADFLGEMNFLSGRVVEVSGGLCTVAVHGGTVRGQLPDGLTLSAGVPAKVAVRPEALTLAPAGAVSPESESGVEGILTETIFNGAMMVMLIERPDGTTMTATLNPRHMDRDISTGQTVKVFWSPQSAIVFAGDAA
jgi:spermidine/putrescine ABC transporter ATP-binding subunit